MEPGIVRCRFQTYSKEHMALDVEAPDFVGGRISFTDRASNIDVILP
jgi:hypothetical protein